MKETGKIWMNNLRPEIESEFGSMPLISWPPVAQRFFRGRTWWNIISTTPAGCYRYFLFRQPILGVAFVYTLYYYGWKNQFIQGKLGRYERWKMNFRADLHSQENKDWETKQFRDGLKSFIEEQKKTHGSFENAVKAYCEKTQTTDVPTFIVDDPVLDYTLRRVGVPVEGPDEPNFLWDGTAWTTKKPATVTFQLILIHIF